MSDDDVAEWVRRSLTLEAGAPLELAPWQAAILARWTPATRAERDEAEARALSSGRRRALARALAASLIYGDRPTIASADRASAEALVAAVLEELDVWGRVLGTDVTPLVERFRVQE